MKGTFTIAFILIAGIFAGYLNLIPIDIADSMSMPILFCLLFMVGISIGTDNEILTKLKSQSPALLLIPFVTIISTLAGVALFGPMLTQRSMAECLAVGSGFGYYSLSSIIITEYIGADLGVVALMSNIIREVTVLMFAPLMVRYFGKLAPISVGGATTMDSTLPIITKTSGTEFVMIAIIHGIIVDFSVPFLVSYFCSIA